MQLLIIGASGRTGKLILREALSKGHTVTALVRNSKSLEPAPGVTIIQGSPTNAPDIENAITSSPSTPAAVLVALNSIRKSDSPFSAQVTPPTMMTDAHINLLTLMKRYGIKKLVTMSALGVGDSNPNVFLPLRMVLNHTSMSIGQDDHNGVEKVVRASDLEWTLVRPCVLSEGEKTDVKIWGNQGKGIPMIPKVSRMSVAAFMVECAETSKFNWMTPVISDNI